MHRTALALFGLLLLVFGLTVALRPPDPRGSSRVQAGPTLGSPARDLDGLNLGVLAYLATTTTTAPPPTTTTSRPPARAQAAPRSTSSPVDWDGIARCETGHDPRNPRPGTPFWEMTGPRFSGGLGFANTTWDAFGGREFAPLAGQASREAQIVVAERVYARFGLSGWGCRAYG